MALPNPFQSATLPSPVLNTAPKTIQNDTTIFHGYRSSFDINQQKQEYQQRMNQQAQYQAKFNRNIQQRNNRNERPDYATETRNYCELCECNFKYPQQLQKHVNEHEKCWFDNCTFEGSAKLLQNHVETQHQSGLFQRIGRIESEEDIEKWREERRKRYPTKANIEARRLAQEERLKRGERIQEPNHRFGSIQNRRSAQHRTFTQNDEKRAQKTGDNKKKNDRKRRRTRNKQNKDDKDKTTPNDKIVAAKSDSVKSEAATAIEQCPASSKEKTVPTTNALATIMGMYGTDSDSNCDDVDEDDAAAVATMATTASTAATLSENKQPDNKQEEHVCNITDNVTAASDPISKAIESNKHSAAYVVADESMENRKRSACVDDELPIKQLKIDSSEQNKSIDHGKENESDDDAPEEQPIQRQIDKKQEGSEDGSGPTEIQKKKKNDTKTLTNDRSLKKRTILDMTRKIRNQNTLLEKLLQKDIRHERNVLLQCVRYVVEKNFFDIGQTTVKTDEENNRIEHS
ncbi:FMR1-interacting protein NUFIP1 [Sitodiplosis mosellana]|uniref:FMR1-interacting protein NUFIP1 n=1 Tax=Sitodiplosis mosellana TaxID=263140 RepID=UPI0024446E82|nr:FMR1-interacting protein NUFIP1 [Sitodiplosis mosellana]